MIFRPLLSVSASNRARRLSWSWFVVSAPMSSILRRGCDRFGRASAALLVVCAIALEGCSSGSPDKPEAFVTGAPTTTTVPTRTAAQVVAALKAKGLPVAEVKDFTAADDPNEQLGRPGGYISKASWHDSRLEASEDFDVDGGGSVEVFANEADAKKRADYIDTVTKSAPFFNEYHWLVGTVFLRVSKSLTPDKAEQYHQALAQ